MRRATCYIFINYVVQLNTLCMLNTFSPKCLRIISFSWWYDQGLPKRRLVSHLVDPIFGYYNQFSPFTTYFTWDWGITSDYFMCDMVTRVRLDFNGGSVKPPLLMPCLCKSTHVHVFSCGYNYVYVPNGLTFVSKGGPWISYLPRSIHERLRGGIHFQE